MLSVTATELQRLMNCNGSRSIEGFKSSIERDTTVRDEGVAADWLVGQVHSGAFTVEELIDRKAANGVYITAEMVEYLEDYLDWTLDCRGQIEVDTSHGAHAWRINGRADHVYYDPVLKSLYISDLKYGWSIVEPKDNWTLISHALGFIANNPTAVVEHIKFFIHQPRAYHAEGRVRHHEITRAELNAYWDQIATTLSNLSDTLNTGSHCRNCPKLVNCPAARNAMLNTIDASERAFTDKLDNAELSFQLDDVNRAINVLKQQQKAYQELALHRLKQGEIVNNYAPRVDQTNRQWQKHVTPEMLLAMTGKELSKPAQLITPAQAEKAGVPKEVVASLTERHTKGVKLVRVDANSNAKKLFEKGN